MSGRISRRLLGGEFGPDFGAILGAQVAQAHRTVGRHNNCVATLGRNRPQTLTPLIDERRGNAEFASKVCCTFGPAGEIFGQVHRPHDSICYQTRQ